MTHLLSMFESYYTGTVYTGTLFTLATVHFLLGNCGIFFPNILCPFFCLWLNYFFFYLQFFVPFLCLFNVYLFFYLGLTHYVTWINHNTCIHFIVLTCQRSFCIIFLFWHRIGILVVFFFFLFSFFHFPSFTSQAGLCLCVLPVWVVRILNQSQLLSQSSPPHTTTTICATLNDNLLMSCQCCWQFGVKL